MNAGRMAAGLVVVLAGVAFAGAGALVGLFGLKVVYDGAVGG